MLKRHYTNNTIQYNVVLASTFVHDEKRSIQYDLVHVTLICIQKRRNKRKQSYINGIDLAFLWRGIEYFGRPPNIIFVVTRLFWCSLAKSIFSSTNIIYMNHEEAFSVWSLGLISLFLCHGIRRTYTAKWESKTCAELKGSKAQEVWPPLADFCNMDKWFPNLHATKLIESPVNPVRLGTARPGGTRQP